MSMKRMKQVTRGRDKDSESEIPWAKKKKEFSYGEHVEGKDNAEFIPYSLDKKFEPGMLVLHSAFGKGVVSDVAGNKMDVLFKEGAKKLGHAG